MSRLYAFLIISSIAIATLCVPSYAASTESDVRVRPTPAHITYKGEGRYTSKFGITIDVSNSNVMFYGMDMHYDTNSLQLDTDAISRGSFYTVNSVSGIDSFFFRVSDDTRSGIASLMGCRMISNGFNKGLYGTDLPLHMNIRFRALDSYLPDTIVLNNFDFRSASGDRLTPYRNQVKVDFRWAQIAKLLMQASPRSGLKSGDNFLLTVTAVDETGDTVSTYNNSILLETTLGTLLTGGGNYGSQSSSTSFGPLSGGTATDTVQVFYSGPASIFTLTAILPEGSDPSAESGAIGALDFNGTDLYTIVRGEGRAENKNGGIHVTLVDDQGDTHTSISTDTGLVVFTNLPDGDYYLLAHDTSVLDRVVTGISIQNGTIVNGSVVVETLVSGDVNADNVINDFDRSLTINFYGQTTSINSFAADLDRDGDIDMDDVNLATNNFGRSGDTPPAN